MNIFIVGSPWHITVAASIARNQKFKNEDCLYLLEHISDSSLKSMLEISTSLRLNIQQAGSIDKVRFANLNPVRTLPFLQLAKKELAEATDIMRLCMSKFAVEKVFYFNIHSPITRAQLIPAINSSATIVRVEDGICDYFPFPFVDYPKTKRAAKRILSELSGLAYYYKRSCPSIKARTSEYLVFYPTKLSNADVSVASLLPYTSAIKELTMELSPATLESNNTTNGSTLLLGQTMAEDNITSLKDELEAYRAAAAECDHVYFKPHPRSTPQKIELVSKIPGIDILHTTSSAESILASNNFSSVAGLWSNTIFYSKPIFGIKSKTLINSVRTNNKQFVKIRDFLNARFPEVTGITH